MNPYFNNGYYPQAQAMQHLPQSIDPKIMPCMIDTAEQMATIPPMPNTIYLGLARDGGKIFQRRMNNDGLLETKTYVLVGEQTKKTDIQEILERLTNIEKKLNIGAENESDVNL